MGFIAFMAFSASRKCEFASEQDYGTLQTGSGPTSHGILWGSVPSQRCFSFARYCAMWSLRGVTCLVVLLLRGFFVRADSESFLKAHVPVLLSELGFSAAQEAQRLMDCMSPESQAEFSKNMTQIGSLLVGAHSHDPLLAMRAGLERLADSLARLLHHLRRCNANEQLWPDFEAMVAQLHRLVAAGRLNDGFCPFTGTRQTTIGGAEVGEVLHGRRLEMTSEGLARLFGRILRLVRAHGDDPDPPGAVPVNWEMRKMMFGGEL